MLALFPGSRQQEIDRHLDDFVRTAQLLEQRHRGLQVVLVATAPGVVVPADRCPYRQVTESSFSGAARRRCRGVQERHDDARGSRDRMSAGRCVSNERWTHAIARRLVRIPRIGLVNVVAGREVAPRVRAVRGWCPSEWPRRCRRCSLHGSPERTEWSATSPRCAINWARQARRGEWPTSCPSLVDMRRDERRPNAPRPACGAACASPIGEHRRRLDHPPARDDVARSTRGRGSVRRDHVQRKESFIAVFWHGEILPVTWVHRGFGGFAALISRHADGEDDRASRRGTWLSTRCAARRRAVACVRCWRSAQLLEKGVTARLHA